MKQVWPKQIPLELKLKDMLEPKVDEKYYLSNKKIESISKWNSQQKPLEAMEKSNISGVVGTITTREADENAGMKLIKEKIEKDKMLSSFQQENYVSIPSDVMHTVTSTGAGSAGKILENVFESGHHAGKVNDPEGIAPTFKENHGVGLFIKENTKKGYAEAKAGDGVYINRPHQKRGVVQKDKIQTIKTQPDTGVVVKDHGNYISLKDDKGRFNTQDKRAWKDEKIIGTIATNDRFTPKVLEQFKNKKTLKANERNSMGNRVHNDEFTSPTLDTGDGKRILESNTLRIRKITPREALRLMGLDDKRIDLIQQSELISHNKQYFIAGNSIVVPVLEAIFKGIDFPKDRMLKVFETFAGYGSQAVALENLGYMVDSHTSEWFTDAIIAYALIHHNKEFYAKVEDLQPHNDGQTKEYYLACLKKWTLSTDSKKPNDLRRLPMERLIQLLAANIVNNNKGSILDIKGKNLDQYDLLTYSFPCQDLSLAGKQKGMSKGKNTRSGLLWEIERILLELKKENKLPKVLLMENVPQIHSKVNMADFEQWQKALMDLGYKNTWKDLNAKHYGVPQNRNRTFMVSMLDGEVEDEKGVQLSLDLF